MAGITAAGSREVPVPLQGWKFTVAIDEVTVAAFSKVSGLEEETEVVEYRAGDDIHTMRKFPGLTSFPAIVLERGLSIDTSLANWRKKIIDLSLGSGGHPPADPGFRSNSFTISLFDKTGVEKVKWRVFDAWPSKLTIADMDAGTSEVVIETLEIAHHGFIRVGSTAGGVDVGPTPFSGI